MRWKVPRAYARDKEWPYWFSRSSDCLLCHDSGVCCCYLRFKADRNPFSSDDNLDAAPVNFSARTRAPELHRSGQREGQIAEFVENDEVHPGEVIGDASLTPARVSASSRLTRSTTLKKRPRKLDRWSSGLRSICFPYKHCKTRLPA